MTDQDFTICICDQELNELLSLLEKERKKLSRQVFESSIESKIYNDSVALFVKIKMQCFGDTMQESSIQT